jgi:hypothetical protein
MYFKEAVGETVLQHIIHHSHLESFGLLGVLDIELIS